MVGPQHESDRNSIMGRKKIREKAGKFVKGQRLETQSGGDMAKYGQHIKGFHWFKSKNNFHIRNGGGCHF